MTNDKIECPQCGGKDIVEEAYELNIDQSDMSLYAQYGDDDGVGVYVCVDCLFEWDLEESI